MPGDTFGNVTIDSVYSIFLLGQFRKAICSFGAPLMLEGVGIYDFGIYDLTWGIGKVDTIVQFASYCMPLQIVDQVESEIVTIHFAENKITINSLNDKIKKVEIFNDVGQKVYKSDFNKLTHIDVSNFAKQLLIVHVYDRKEHFSQKVIPQ